MTGSGIEQNFIRFHHPDDDSSKRSTKKYFSAHPLRNDVDAQPIYKGICIDAAIDGLGKPYICPARVVLADGSPTAEVLLQLFVTDCITRRIDCYARNIKTEEVYRLQNFTTDYRTLGKFTDHNYPVDYDESKQQFLDFIKKQRYFERISKYFKVYINMIY